MAKAKRKIIFPERELLLAEIERRCAECGARNRIALTKTEAKRYDSFECERCGARNEDCLNESDAPEWWEEIAITGMDALRPPVETTNKDLDEEGARELTDGAEALIEELRREREEAERELNAPDDFDETEEMREVRELIRRAKEREKIF